MTRKKVKLVWIVNDAARKASLKKRRIGLLKKVSELTTLCGVSAFAIIYSPDESEPMIWPSRPVVEQLVMRFQTIPEIERCKKMMNQESYLKERMGKVQEQSKKNNRKNREVELGYLMDRLHHSNTGADDLETSELQCLIWLMEEKMKELRKRIDYFQQVPPLPPGPFAPPLSLPLPLPLPPLPPTQFVGGGSGGGGGDNGGEIKNNPTDIMLWDQWFLDIINNNNNGTGGSGTKNDLNHPSHGYNITGDMGFFHSGSFLPGNFGGSNTTLAGNTANMGFPHGNINMGLAGNTTSLGFPQGNINMGLAGNNNPMGFPQGNINMGLQTHHDNTIPIGGNPFGGLGLQPHINIAGSNNVNPMGMGLPPLPPPTTTTGGGGGAGDLGLPGFFAGGSDIGLPYDVTKPWPHNFSP